MPGRTAQPEPELDDEPSPDGGAPGSGAPGGGALDGGAPGGGANGGGTSEPGTREAGFFGWVRGLDMPRRQGWVGGVCAGIAAAVGVDALLVRGVAVVLAVLGAPVALVYALGWFLLPDERGVIHAQELGRGRVSRAIPGIVGVLLLSFLPVAQGFWIAGAVYWGDPGIPGVALRVVWTALVVVAAIVAVVWLARRSGRSDLTTVPATTDDRPETVPRPPDDPSAPGAAVPFATQDGPAVRAPQSGDDPVGPALRTEPPAPPPDASAEELAEWRRGQEEWRRQRAEWAAEQRRSDRERRQAEAQARAVEAMEAARERARIRRLTRPRAGAGVVVLVVGIALVAAAVAAWTAQSSPSTRDSAWIVGAAVLVLLLGAGIVVVGLLRRRSGVLTLCSALAVLGLVVALAMPHDRQLLPIGTTLGLDTSVDGRYAQLAGDTILVVPDRDGSDAPVIDLWQLFGSVSIAVPDDATVRLELTTDAARQVFVQETFPDGAGRTSMLTARDGRLVATLGAGEPDLVLRVWAGGAASIWINADSTREDPLPIDPEPESRTAWGDEEPSPSPDPAAPDLASPDPTPSPATPDETATEGATP